MRRTPIMASLLIAAAALMIAPRSTSAEWSTANHSLLLDGSPVVLHGFGSTCTEYLLRGIGENCFAAYDWSNPAQLMAQLDKDEVQNGIVRYLSQPAADGIKTAVRIPLTASSWLNITTKAAEANMEKYPDLGGQYQSLVKSLVQVYTSSGIVVILDLHWSDDDTEQQPMALKTRSDGGPTGNAVDFWTSIAQEFGDNDMVFYELYNEPHTDVATWMNGTDQYAGMLELIDAVRSHSPKGVLVIAGAAAYAYDVPSLILLESVLQARGERNVMYNFHPYMGPNQAGAKDKCQDGFDNDLKQTMAKTDKPVIITEFGQTCCATDGACESCPSTYGGVEMGYDEAILTIANKHGVSWLPWSWRPGASGGGPGCMDLNGGDEPKGRSLLHDVDGKGADFLSLWANFSGISLPPAMGPSPTKTPSPGCHACGYNCHGNCLTCGHCNTKPGCMSENQCLTTCNSGQNAMWCGGGAPAPKAPAPKAPAPKAPAPAPTKPPAPSPAPKGSCPGGSLAACMHLCPSAPPAAFHACADLCAQDCV